MPTITSFPVGRSGGNTIYVHVRDFASGEDLYTQNADTDFEYAASLGKLMTALLCYEYHSSDLTSGTVTVTLADISTPIAGLDSMGLQTGDIITWEGLLYGLFLPSGFDACQAIARVIGDEIYVAAGSTGTQGITRFVERMNARALELGMNDTTYENCYGGSTTAGPVVRNIQTARDISTVCYHTFQAAALRTIATSPTRTQPVTGASPRNLSLTNYNRFANGPTDSQQGVSDATVLGGKNGTWTSGGDHHSISIVYETPSGTEVVITVLNAETLYSAMLDVRGLMYSIPRDHPDYDSDPEGDPDFGNVQLLIGFDGSIVDESAAARTLTTSSVTVGDAVSATEGGGVWNNVADYVRATDDASLRTTTGNTTIELWYASSGVEPASEYVWFGKADHTGSPQREWLLAINARQINMFVSTDGSGWVSTAIRSLSTEDVQCFFNGAPRHLAMVKNGTAWRTYINGERTGGTITGNIPGCTAHPSVGYYASAASFLGRADDFRLTIGTARYTAAMVTLDGSKFPRSVDAPEPPPPPPPPPPPQPYTPPGGPGGLPMAFSFPPASARPGASKLRISYPVVNPAGQAAQAAAAAQILMPTFPRTAIVRGPWSAPLLLVEHKEHVQAPAPPRQDVFPPPFPVTAPIPGPWNAFNPFRIGTGGGGQFAPVPVSPGSPPPPPPPGTGAIGGDRRNVPKVPLDPDTTNNRTRNHTQKVAGLLNSLLRAGYIRLDALGEYQIVGGSFALPRAPAATDDMTLGAVVGAHFVNTLTQDVYICVNNSVGSAVWKLIATS